MITAMVGLPRSGKSYNTVQHQILPALRAGRRVATNIPLYEDVIREEIKTGELVQFNVQEFQQEPARIFDVCTPGTVFILDEVWRLFPAGLKADRVPEPFRKLLAEHGHMVDGKGDACQIVLVTQDLAQVAAFARQLVEQTIVHKKMGMVLSSKQFRVDIYDGSHTGQNPPESRRLRQSFGTYSPAVWKYYKSHTLSQAEKDGANEKSIDRRASIWRRPSLWITFAACVLFLLWGVPKAASFIHNPTGKELPAASGATGRQSTPVRIDSRAPLQTAPEQVSATWRVSGWIDLPTKPDASTAILKGEGGELAMLPLARCERARLAGRDTFVCRYQGRLWDEFGEATETMTVSR